MAEELSGLAYSNLPPPIHSHPQAPQPPTSYIEQ